MEHLHGLDYRPTAFRLDWMDEGQEDLKESSSYLAALVKDVKRICYISTSCATAFFRWPYQELLSQTEDLITWWKAVPG